MRFFFYAGYTYDLENTLDDLKILKEALIQRNIYERHVSVIYIDFNHLKYQNFHV